MKNYKRLLYAFSILLLASLHATLAYERTDPNQDFISNYDFLENISKTQFEKESNSMKGKRNNHAFRLGSIKINVIDKHSQEKLKKQKALEEIRAFEDEKRNKIYRQHLASIIGGSILRDFLTRRFFV